MGDDWHNGSMWASMEYEAAMYTYQNFNAMRLHFQGKYDWHKHGAALKVKFETFVKRKDKNFFLKLHRRFEQYDEGMLIAHLAANFIENPKCWIQELLSKTADDRRKDFIAKNEAFPYEFRNWVQDTIPIICQQNNCKFLDLIRPQDGEMTWLQKAIIADKIPMHILVGFDRITGFINTYETQYEDDPMWQEINDYLKIVRGFYVFDYQPSARFLINFLKDNNL